MSEQSAPGSGTSIGQLSGTWRLDPAATRVTVSAKNFFVITVDSTVEVRSGEAVVADDGRAELRFALDATSVASGNRRRDKHLRSDDFLDAERFPTIDFTSDEIVVRGDDVTVRGLLTVHGSSEPFEFRIHDLRRSDDRATFAASAAVDRRRIGLGKLPALMIGNEIRVSVSGAADRVVTGTDPTAAEPPS